MMKRLIIASILTVISILALNPIGASASTGGWRGDNASGWLYTDDTGNYVTGWQQIQGQWYYMNEQGLMLHDTTINGYTLGSNGAWIQSSNNYSSKGGGVSSGAGSSEFQQNLQQSSSSTSAGQSANDKLNGSVKAGKDTAAGQRIAGMNGMGDTTTTSTSTSQKSTSGGWEKVDDQWYYNDANGIMKTGWIQDSGNWYFLNNDGAMAHDTTVGGYYLGSNGAWTQSSNPFYFKNKGGVGKAGNDPAAADRISNMNR